MTVPLWLVGVLVYAVGCLVSGKYHLSFLWFDREVLPGTLLEQLTGSNTLNVNSMHHQHAANLLRDWWHAVMRPEI